MSNMRFMVLAVLAAFAVENGFADREEAGEPRQSGQSRYEVDQLLGIARVPADFPVGFSLLTDNDRKIQYAAFYNMDRQMTVAARGIDSDRWRYQSLPSSVGWDSHNYITMAVDRDGHLHVSGNMHADPLVYFRTAKAGDITSLREQPMVGDKENRMTYPRFINDNDGNLTFIYRHGGSGSGMRICNKYDPETQTWSRLINAPLFDGEQERNAYPHGPVRGPDGLFHVLWVWRKTPDCATNHHLSYARSPDLVNWESAFGEPVELPLRFEQKELVVDPIPIGGGIINGCQELAFDADNRPMATYHKADEDGNMQIYAARPEDGEWRIRPLTDWSEPVPFEGMGSMGFIGIRISGLARVEPGLMTMTYRHKDYGPGRIFIDEETLRPTNETAEIIPDYPAAMRRVRSDFPGMHIKRAHDLGDYGEEGVEYLLQWETLEANHDRARQPPLPRPSVLVLVRLVRAD